MFGDAYYWVNNMEIYLAFTSLLLAISIVDIEKYIIPNKFVLALLALTVIKALYADSTIDMFVGLGVAFVMSYIAAYTASALLDDEAMGGGDIKLMTVIGGFVGAKAFVSVYILAACFGLLFSMVKFYRCRRIEIPYAPCLTLASLITLCR